MGTPRSDVTTADLAARLDDMFGILRTMQRDLQRLQQPLVTMTAEQVCEALKCSRSGLSKIDARRVFTDARPKHSRRRGRSRLYFADEVTNYQIDGVEGVSRLRREVGRT